MARTVPAAVLIVTVAIAATLGSVAGFTLGQREERIRRTATRFTSIVWVLGAIENGNLEWANEMLESALDYAFADRYAYDRWHVPLLNDDCCVGVRKAADWRMRHPGHKYELEGPAASEIEMTVDRYRSK